MTLSPGTRLGPYTIESRLGSGGMGDVYRAHDTRLARVVAIKTPSARLASDEQAIGRFEREARAVAALNHPNICTIYDVGTDPPFIAMELLEGETLEQRLTRGPIDLLTAIDLTLAVVDALDTAHSRGTLHRDLKPANIFLTPRGPKILDFGLAKAIPTPQAPGSSGQATMAPDSMLTGEYMMVGTLAYMSPEQLRGQPLDGRSDLFSLGLVMYEMVTGRRAFEGETSAVIAAAILREAPPPPRELREDLPEKLEAIILKTIEKDPRDRTQTAAELRADLRRLKRETDSGSFATATYRHGWSSSGSAPPSSRPGSRSQMSSARSPRLLPWVVAAAAMALIVLGYVLWSRNPFSGKSPNALLQNVQISRVTVSGNAWRPTLSPDGRYVVYVRRDGVDRSLRVRQLGTDRDVEIVAADAGLTVQGATVTPDGAYIDYVRGRATEHTLWRVPFLGGAPRRLVDNVNSPIGWSPDGRRFAFVRAGVKGLSTLVVADADGTNERPLATRTLPAQFLSFGMRGTPSGEGAAMHPAWSPDGQTLALIGFEVVDEVVTRQAVFVDVDTGTQRSIPMRDRGSADGIQWLDGRHLLLSQQGPNDVVSQLWVLSYPDATWSRLTNDLSNYASFGISADRQSIVAAQWDYQVGVWSLEEGASEPSEVVAPSPFVGDNIGWARDRLLYAVLSPADNKPSVWVVKPGMSQPEELIANASSPKASSDGQVVVFVRVENGRRGIWRADAEGRAPVELALTAGAQLSITPDGRQVVYVSNESGTQATWIAPTDAGTPRQVADVFAYFPTVSRDGASLAFVTVNQENRPVLAVCALSDCSSRSTFPLMHSPLAVQWTPDGQGIAYSALSNIWVQPRSGGAAYQLTKFPEDDHRIKDFEWSADGRRLAFSRSRTAWDLVLFRGTAGE